MEYSIQAWRPYFEKGYKHQQPVTLDCHDWTRSTMTVSFCFISSVTTCLETSKCREFETESSQGDVRKLTERLRK